MARIHAGIVSKAVQHAGDRADQRLEVAARQIRAPDRAGKERVADEQVEALLAAAPDLQTHAAGTMSRRVMDEDVVVAKGDRAGAVIEDVDRRRGLDLETEHQAVLYGL